MSTQHDPALTSAIHTRPDGTGEMTLLAEGLRCAGCIVTLEKALTATPGVQNARVNYSTQRVRLVWKGTPTVVQKAIQAAAAKGYTLTPYSPSAQDAQQDADEKFLLRCLAVAAFAVANVMLLAIPLWAGVVDESQRLLLQWLSALITLPCLAYAGQPYFNAAYVALRHGRVGMEVPISLAIILTCGISLFDVWVQRGDTYFESAAMLLFFLLIGRYLETRVRGRSRQAAARMMQMQNIQVALLGKTGKVTLIPAAEAKIGQLVLWRHGERLGVDGMLTDGDALVDTSLLTGESLPRTLANKATVQAGMVNMGEARTVRVTQVGQGTVLAELARLIDTATAAKNNYTRLADALARRYAPVVHGLAFITFVGNMVCGLGWHDSLLRAAAVLLVTCPCALALAVPTVHVAVMGKLLRMGIVLTSGDALERLGTISRVVMDKTGTLTTGKLSLVRGGTADQRHLAARLAVLSQHPLAQAIVRAVGGASPLPGAKEHVGKGVEGTLKGKTVRFGSASWCGVKNPPPAKAGEARVWLRVGNGKPVVFHLTDTLRPDAREALKALAAYRPMLLSGDSTAAVQAMAHQAGVTEAYGDVSPTAKQDMLAKLHNQGARVLMAGDGLNDAPSLALADIGLSFGQASDLAKLSADVILQQEELAHIPRLLRIARQARRAVMANFGLAFVYNLASVPLAMIGYITPMAAALLMSTSSLIVVANAARLGQK